MGNNFAFTVFEKTVVGAYDLGVLDKELLTVIMEPYRGLDIDSGGKMGLATKDGLQVEEVVIKVWGGELPEKPELTAKYEDLTEEEMDLCDEYFDALYEQFQAVTDQFEWC